MGQAAEQRVAQNRERGSFDKVLSLVRNAQKQPLPFFGNGAEFRDLFNGKLTILADPQRVTQQLPAVGQHEGRAIRFDAIRTKGYRSRGLRSLEMAETKTAKLSSSARNIGIELGESEVGMVIAGDGRLVRIGPVNHRFATAQQLGLTSIRAEIRLFHVRFLRNIFESEGNMERSSIIEAVRRLAAPAPQLAAVHPPFQTSSEDATP